MTLDQWLTRNKISTADFAKKIGRHRSTIHRLRVGGAFPTWGTAKKIILATRSQVHLYELYGSIGDRRDKAA